MPDAYAEAIQYFTKFTGDIEEAWLNPGRHEYGYLFQYLTLDGKPGRRPDGKECGDPIQIKSCEHWINEHLSVAWTDELTMAIRSNEWIPRYFGSMLTHARVAALPIIADAQRLADQMLGRQEPNSANLQLGAGI